MKKLTILLVVIILIAGLFAGCNGFDLSSWVCPDDQEFIALLDSLDTPKKICGYMEDNFDWNISIHTYSPYQVYLANLEGWNDTGDCDDFVAFAAYAANWNGYTIYRIKMWIKYTGFYGLPLILPHVMTIFVEDGLYTYANNCLYNPLYEDDFKSIVQDYELTQYPVISYRVYDYENNLVEKGYT